MSGGVQFPGAANMPAGELRQSFYPSDPHVRALVVVRGANPADRSVLTLNPSATERLFADEVAIKSYGFTHEGVYDALVSAKIVAPAHRFIPQGYVARVPVCRVLVAVPELGR